MAKKIRCQTCGRLIRDGSYVNMWDERTQKIVPVCEDAWCQRRYKKPLKEVG